MFSTPRRSGAENKLLASALMECVKADNVEALTELLSVPGLGIKSVVLVAATTEAPKITQYLAARGTVCRCTAVAVAVANKNMVFLRHLIPGCEIIVREMAFYILLLNNDVEMLREFLEFAPAPYCKDLKATRTYVGPGDTDFFDKFEGTWAWPVDLSGPKPRGYVNDTSAFFAAKKLKKLANK
jgi:hypothetical protein